MSKEIVLNLGLAKLDVFASEIGVSESTLRTWRRRGNIPSICFKKIGGTVLVVVNEFKKWMDGHENN